MSNNINTRELPATAEARLIRLLSSCHRMKENLDNLVSTLSIIDDVIPDKEDVGCRLSGMIHIVLDHQNEQFSDFVSEIRYAEGEAA